MNKKMKGVILAGGGGTRLYPNTKVTNKHLLPVYNQPMIYYPVQMLLKAGISDILILPGKDHAGDFAKLLGSGKDFNANFSFKIQDHAGGLAYAVGLAEEFVGDDNFVVVLGDNILEDDISEDVSLFKSGAKIFLKEVHDPERFGVAELDGVKIVSLEEKPNKPKSNWAAIGVYIFDSKAFSYIKTLKPSDRGELEITDLNNIYIKNAEMQAGFIHGYWFDTGTHESLVEAAYKLKGIARPAELVKLEEKKSPKVVVGGILYNSVDNSYATDKYLPYFIESIKKQDYPNVTILLVDNSEKKDNPNSIYLKNNYPEIEIIYTGENTGFARANNLLITRAKELSADYFVSSNIDAILEKNVVLEVLNAMIKNHQAGSATCKIKKWDFEKKDSRTKGMTNFIDSVGISITEKHQFFNKGQGDIDYGQYDDEIEVFGGSGALTMFRISSLDDIAFVNEDGRKEYFDELMFMYKEDVDIAYRLQIANYKCMYTSKAVVYHDRSIFGKGEGLIDIVKGRFAKPKINKEWSWLNHHIILQKMLDNNTYDIRMKTFWHEMKSMVYIVFFEPYLIKQVWELFKLKDKINKRKGQIKKRVEVKSHFEKLMTH